MELQNAKGVRDFGPAEKKVRQHITSLIQETFEEFGYLPLETPVIERKDVLISKYTGGEEITKEMYVFTDQGGRELALRYDLTVPFARFVGMNKELKMPFKRYHIDRVFRDGPMKTGRYREFWQCDGDIVGCKDVTAEAELLSLAQRVFEKLGVEYSIEINSRKILTGIMEQAGIRADRQNSMILVIDKFEKVGEAGVKKELVEKGFSDREITDVFFFVKISGTNKGKIEFLKEKIENEIGKAGIQEVEKVLGLLEHVNHVIFSPFLARGLAYYTGLIYEFFLADRKEFGSSIGAGGRYDKMIGDLLESKQEYPAVGVSFGLDVLSDIIMKKQKIQYAADVFVVPIQKFKEGFRLAQFLRKDGVKVDMDLMERGITKNLKYADSLGIPYVIIVGEEEMKAGKFTFKDMKSGVEDRLTFEEIVERVRRKK